MELRTRWRKIIKDIWGNKTRSLLVILSIAVGVAAIGMINNTMYMLRRDLFGAHSAGNPASVSLYVSPFDTDLASAVEAMREVESVQAHRTLSARLIRVDGAPEDIQLDVIPDFDNMAINQYSIEQGTEGPSVRKIMMERRSAEGLDLGIGDVVTIETEDKQRYSLIVSGIVHDLYNIPYNILGDASAYVSMDTLRWMGEQPYYNRLDVIVAENQGDREHALDIAAQARDRVIETSGYEVYRIAIPGINSDPGQHWAQSQINGFVLVLQVMSVLAIFLSGGLVVNSISAILSQQIRQIGILRSIGGVRRQLIGMYVANVFVLSALGLAMGLPLGMLGAWWLTNFAAGYLNFDVTAITPDPSVTLLQVAVGLIMPLVVAFVPIFSGTRISVYDAIYQYGLSSENQEGGIDALLAKVRNMHPPVMLSLRNTFRKKARLAFTLITLTLAGAMFMSVFSTRASLTGQINQIARYVAFDASLNVMPGLTRSSVEREAMRIPGVTVAEGWVSGSGILMRADGSEGDEIQLYGVPYDSVTIDPLLIDGRWLLADDTNGVVVNDDLLERKPDTSVGNEITVKVTDQERTYQIVGIVTKHLSGPRVYMTYETFGKATGRANQADMVRVRLEAAKISSPAAQKRLAAELEEHFQDAGLSKSSSQTQSEIFGSFTGPFDIILMVLVIMAGLLAVVGGLSLAGTMGMNVMERTREIGVLRAVGANSQAVRQVVVIEGVAVGLLSWLLSVAVSGPAGVVLAGAVVYAVFKAPVNFQYSFEGLAIWLVVIVLIGVFSSLAPARSAARLTVREVLDYE
ncbi:MAG: ABC transporter permease [Anaerolineae bacterium]|nr:ABC transporter permease [Anaerolineae bacterium]